MAESYKFPDEAEDANNSIDVETEESDIELETRPPFNKTVAWPFGD